ncbi:hypothetical protein Tco_1186424 [Tanacetum coccineum]
MSSPTHTDLDIIPPTVGAQSSLVPTPFHDDPYLAVRKAYLHTTRDTDSEPEEAPLETEEFQPSSTRSAPLSSDHTPIPPDYTPVSPLIDEEFEASEPSDTRITTPHSTTPSDSTTPLSLDHLLTQRAPTPTPARAFFYHRTARMVVRTQPALPPVISARMAEAMTLSPSSFRKRYRGTSELLESTDTETEDDESEAEGANSGSEESEDEGLSSERERGLHSEISSRQSRLRIRPRMSL